MGTTVAGMAILPEHPEQFLGVCGNLKETEMAEHPGFLQAIIDEPDDDTHRLIYADWLEDHGEQILAEFIRLQCELERLPEKHPEHAKLKSREDTLWQAHNRYFLGPLAALNLPLLRSSFISTVNGVRFIHQRGFVEMVEVRGSEAAKQFVSVAATVFRHCPLQFVELGGGHHYLLSHDPIHSETIATFLNMPEIARLRSLDLRLQLLHDSDAHELLRSPYLTERITLVIGRHPFSPRIEHALSERFGKQISFD
jgi:uncharacterized protein (TIGR02996 family)